MIKNLCRSLAVAGLSIAVASCGPSGGRSEPATLVAPIISAVLGTTQRFEWADTGAEFYQLWVGSSEGTYDIGAFPPDSGTRDTSAVVEGIPQDAHAVYVRLFSLFDGEWQHQDYRFKSGGKMLSLAECASNMKLWVLDVGTRIPGQEWVQSGATEKGQTLTFKAHASDHEGSAYQQADVGCGNGNARSKGRWDFTKQGTLSFGFKDLNPSHVDEQGNSTLLHYVLVYDRNYRYHQWFLDDPKGANKLTFRPGEWVDVTVALSDDPSTYYNSGYNLAEPFDWSEVIFFEVGIFGPDVARKTPLSWEISVDTLPD